MPIWSLLSCTRAEPRTAASSRARTRPQLRRLTGRCSRTRAGLAAGLTSHRSTPTYLPFSSRGFCLAGRVRRLCRGWVFEFGQAARTLPNPFPFSHLPVSLRRQTGPRHYVVALGEPIPFPATLAPQFVDGAAVSASPQLAGISRVLPLSVCLRVRHGGPGARARRGHRRPFLPVSRPIR